MNGGDLAEHGNVKKGNISSHGSGHFVVETLKFLFIIYLSAQRAARARPLFQRKIYESLMGTILQKS